MNALRLALALLVIISHSAALGGYSPEILVSGETLGRWAVFGFFGLSGFLITRSRLSGRPVSDYYAARVLRIFPAFVVSLLLVAFVMAPLSHFFGSSGTYSPVDAITFFFRNLALYPPVAGQSSIADTLSSGVAVPDTWNGSLWTIWYEAACYMAIGVLVSLVARKYVGMVLLAAFVALTGVRLLSAWEVVTLGHLTSGVLPLAIAFLAGALLHIYANRIRVNPMAVSAAVALVAVSISMNLASALVHLPFTFLLILLGQVLPLQRIGAKYDISYGVYIYAWPVQQCLALAFPHQSIPYWAFISATVGIVAVLAWLSCKFIEQPALRLKRRTPEQHAVPVFAIT
ncbi:hypothetical protein AOC05_10595 [Arthrobacter alpinus]|uniref:Acyltransferase 3 domain-containing protein n=1 Tax=Arthrobacter alpinus TaxID=656366 RepID=A0A0M5LXQ5_9MICC|nr:acyltransferase [Arthrobacter alpinus]ALE92650.1 hypothetical protein AOC05_10595 [Arthrobacter alpinus]